MIGPVIPSDVIAVNAVFNATTDPVIVKLAPAVNDEPPPPDAAAQMYADPLYFKYVSAVGAEIGNTTVYAAGLLTQLASAYVLAFAPMTST